MPWRLDGPYRLNWQGLFLQNLTRITDVAAGLNDFARVHGFIFFARKIRAGSFIHHKGNEVPALAPWETKELW